MDGPWLCSVARGLSRPEPTLIAQLIAANHRNCSLTQQLHGCRISFAFLGCSLMHRCSFGAHFGRSARAGDALRFSQPVPDAVCPGFASRTVQFKRRFRHCFCPQTLSFFPPNAL